jgi:Flp pilus assembly protein TadB
VRRTYARLVCLDGVPVNKLIYRGGPPWSPLEVALWISGVLVLIIGGILLASNVVGSWVVILLGVISVALGLLRYRAQAEQKRRNADDRESEVTRDLG